MGSGEEVTEGGRVAVGRGGMYGLQEAGMSR